MISHASSRHASDSSMKKSEMEQVKTYCGELGGNASIGRCHLSGALKVAGLAR